MRVNHWVRWSILVLVGFATHLAHAEELTVSAAASLTNAFQEVAKGFEKEHPGHKVLLNFAASGPLLQQIAQGAPADVYASADQESMDKAQASQLILAQTRVNFASNMLVLVVPAARAAPAALADLSQAVFARIAIGNPTTVPAGRYTTEIVRNAGLESSLQERWIYGDSVRQVLNYVARAEVDAAFVYKTDALVEKQKVRIALTLNTPTPVTYPMAVVARSQHAALAQNFIDYVRSSAGQAVLGQFGFGKP